MYSDRIKELRLARGMSRNDLAAQMGVSSTAVYKWETAQSQPDIFALEKMAKLFDVTLDSLCDFGQSENTGSTESDVNIAVMTRAFRQLTPADQERMLAVGRALFGSPFPKAKE